MKTMCPQEELMADYLEDRLSKNKRIGVESHLSDCHRCLDEMIIFHGNSPNPGNFETDTAPQHVTNAAVTLVEQLASHRRTSFMQRSIRLFKTIYLRISDYIKLIMYHKDGFASVRGSKGVDTSDFYRVRKMFKEMVTEIEIEKAGSQIASIRVSLINGSGNEPDIRVTLRNSGRREIASYIITPKFVVFENIPFGHYSLAFIQNGRKIGTYRFEIKESD